MYLVCVIIGFVKVNSYERVDCGRTRCSKAEGRGLSPRQCNRLSFRVMLSGLGVLESHQAASGEPSNKCPGGVVIARKTIIACVEKNDHPLNQARHRPTQTQRG